MENENILHPIDLSIFKEHIRNSFLTLVDQLPKGPKILMIDPPLISLLDFFLELDQLKEREIVTIMHLSKHPLSNESKTVIYFIHPKISNLENIAFQIQDHLKTKVVKNYFAIFIPKNTYDCQQFIENNKLKADLNVLSLPIDMLPLEKDVLSLEAHDTIPQLFLKNDTTVLSTLVRSIIKFESIFGKIKYKYAKGDHAKTLKKLLESEEDVNPCETEDQILAAVFIDRNVDFITPLCTQYTYEGMIDELIGIKMNTAKFPSKVFEKTDSKDVAKILSSEKDSLYSSIRDFNFNFVRVFLPQKLKEINQLLAERNEQKTIEQISNYLDRLKKIKEDFSLVSSHINIADYISNLIKHPINTEYLKYEQNLLVGEIPFGLYEFYDNEIAKQSDIIRVIRLLGIETFVQNGIKKNLYDNLKKDILHVSNHYKRQAYGFQEVFLLRNLERMKIIKKQDGRSNYEAINEGFKLIVEDVNVNEPNDPSYVFGGYCPITIRLIENVIKKGWNPIKELIKKLPGETEFPANEREIFQPKSKQNFILLVFIGGITYAEISAIRYLNSKRNTEHKFIILTTHIINGKTLINSLRVNFDQVLSYKDFQSQLRQLQN